MTAALAGGTDTAFDQVVAHLTATLSGLGLDEGTIGEITGGLAPLRADIAATAVDGF
ncbi:MAG: hypothetical protein ACRDYA_05605 [Egibacteraceae bacterium]